MHFQYLVASAAFASVEAAVFKSPCTPGQWTELASIPTPRQEHGTVAVNNDTIAILGGITPTGAGTETVDLLQLYDVPSNSWRTGSPAPIKVNHPNIASIGNDIYLLGGLVDGPLTGGLSLNWLATKSAYVYSLVTDKWTELPPLPNGTERGSAVVGVHGDIIYLAGGMTILQNGYQDAVNTVVAFNTTSRQWQRLPAIAAEIPESRQHSSGAVIGDTFYVVGGRWYGQMNHRDTVFELNLNDLSSGWSTSTGRMPVARGGLSGSKVGKKFYAFGGEGNSNTLTGVFNQTESFDTETQKWIELAPMDVPRHGTQSASIGNLIYIPGGGLQQDGKAVTIDNVTTYERNTNYFDAYCAQE